MSCEFVPTKTDEARILYGVWPANRKQNNEDFLYSHLYEEAKFVFSSLLLMFNYKARYIPTHSNK